MSLCDSCKKKDPKFKCSACKCYYYCSKECAKLHWVSGHKEECKAIATNSERIKNIDTRVDETLIKLKGLTDDDVCSICLERFNITNVFTLPCNHFLCGICIFELPGKINATEDGEFEEKPPTCPQCRAEMPPINNLLQYLYEKSVQMVQRLNRCPLLSDKQLICTFVRNQYKLIDSYLNALESESDYKTINRESINFVWGLLDVDILLLEKKADECIIAANNVLEKNSSLLDIEMKIQLYIQIGKSYILKSSYKDAFKTFQSAISLTEHNMAKEVREIYHNITRVFYELKDYDNAIQFGESAVEMNRHYDGVYNYLALAYKDSGKLDKAIETMKLAVLYETPWDEENKITLNSKLELLITEFSAEN